MQNSFSAMPPVTKNLLLANVLVFVLFYVCYAYATGLPDRASDVLSQFVLPHWASDVLGLHFVLASGFRPWQLLTYAFLHGNLVHLFFNMFALWMFGTVVEQTLGSRRFLWFYAVCGLGAALCQELWQGAEYLASGMSQYDFVNVNGSVVPQVLNGWTTIGASGAIYGVLLAFGYLYPNQVIMLLIPPIRLKAKYFVIVYIVIEVVSVWKSSVGVSDGVAHIAHLGGMLFGWLLLRHWRRQAQGGKAGFLAQLKQLWQRVARGRKKGMHFSGGRAMGDRQADYDYNLRKQEQERRVDEILGKVRRSGYDSLTREEREYLFNHTRN